MKNAIRNEGISSPSIGTITQHISEGCWYKGPQLTDDLAMVFRPLAYETANSEPTGVCEASRPSCASVSGERRGA